LRSVAFCDEVIVVDSGSSDRTLQIAQDSGAKVFENPWPGFGAQRNFALDRAGSDWILEVDADERVSPQLRADIEAFLAMPPPSDVKICVLPLRHRFLGRLLGPSAKYPAYRTRLFRRDSYRHDEARLVHEGIWPQGRTWAMRGHLEHELAGSVREALHDAAAYSRLEAGHVEPLPGPIAYFKAIAARPAAKAVYRTVVDGGWRDGPRGLLKIALDSGSDSAVWTRRALGRHAGAQGAQGTFGRVVLRSGEPRLCAVVPGTGAVEWLRRASDAGADVALITDADVDGGDWLHVERVEKLSPLRIVRALDAVGQMRPVDQLVLDGPRRPHWLRLVSPSARGLGDPATLADDPATIVPVLRG
jgi:hypothetical protein